MSKSGIYALTTKGVDLVNEFNRDLIMLNERAVNGYYDYPEKE